MRVHRRMRLRIKSSRSSSRAWTVRWRCPLAPPDNSALEDPFEAAGDPLPVRAVPEDAPAAPAQKELLVVPNHAWRNPVRDRSWRHGRELSVALHTTRRATGEREAIHHEPALLLEREVRYLHEPHAPVAYRPVFQEAAIARQEHAPLFERLLREGAVGDVGPLAGVVGVVAGGAQPLRQPPEHRVAEEAHARTPKNRSLLPPCRRSWPRASPPRRRRPPPPAPGRAGRPSCPSRRGRLLRSRGLSGEP